MFEDLTIVMDIDGSICPVRKQDERYEDLIPFENVVNRLKEYKELGATIVLYTSRNVNTYKNNIGLINANTAKILLQWLEKWNIPYDEIHYGKPWPGKRGFYVDDRSVRVDEFLKHTPDELEEICTDARSELK
ncbi:MAG: capsular biosynthesis protein [Vallitalea sp.]|jgi:capsule biosynthesis phosphatase|nr:capsular biosynthesis protein [Vallitalea sp.]